METRVENNKSEKNSVLVDLSIIIPAYNEEDRIEPTLLQIESLVNGSRMNVEVIVVNDGSIDSTFEKVSKHMDRFSNLKIISHEINMGKGAAVRSGILSAMGEKIIFVDADFSYPITRLEEICQKLEEFDVIIGSRAHPGSRMKVAPPFHRKCMAIVFNYFARYLLGLPYHDTQCGFKGFKRKPALLLFNMAHIDGFSFDAEILFLAQLLGFKIYEIPVSLVHSFGSRLSLFKDAWNMTIDLVKIRYFHWKKFYLSRVENKSTTTKV